MCDQPCYKYRLAVGTGDLVIHTAVARTLNIECTYKINMYGTFSSQVTRCPGFHYKHSSTKCYLAKQPSFRKYHVIITIVCSCNIDHVSENFREYCVGYELMHIVSPQERSGGRPFCLVNM